MQLFLTDPATPMTDLPHLYITLTALRIFR
jgi:hypothetical protein